MRLCVVRDTENDLIVNVLFTGWVSLYIISALSAHIPYLADLVNKDGDLFLLCSCTVESWIIRLRIKEISQMMGV